MTNASKTAYIESAEHRKIIKDMINRLYLTGFQGTIREAAGRLGLTYNQTQKRISELKIEGKLMEIGDVYENGKLNSYYGYLVQKPKEVKLPFPKWVRKYKPELLSEWREYYNG